MFTTYLCPHAVVVRNLGEADGALHLADPPLLMRCGAMRVESIERLFPPRGKP